MAQLKRHREQLPQKVWNDPGFLGRPLPSADERPEWQKFRDTWTGAKAKGYLRGPLPAEMPSSGPLSKLLATTMKTICVGQGLSDYDVLGAIETGAVAVLAMLLGWLQQRPSAHHHSKITDVCGVDQPLWAHLVFTLDHLLGDAIETHQTRCSDLLAQLQQDTRKKQHQPTLHQKLGLHCSHAEHETRL